MSFVVNIKYTKSIFASLVGSCLLTAPSAPAQAPIILSSGWQLQSAAAVSDSGSAISQTTYAAGSWYTAAVPGTVLTTLVNAGVYPEPLYGTNNFNIPDSLCHTSYWYRTAFNVPSSYAGRRVWLNFKGINYIGTVWVNGSNVGTVQGAFARGIFDITPLVNIGGQNALAVLVQPEPNPGAPHQKTIATGTGQNGGDTGRDGPTFLCSIGWDWIPTIRDRDTGIWQDVTISASGPVVIQNPYVTSQLALPGLGSADLTIQTTVTNATGTAQSGTLTGVVDGTNTFSQSVNLAANTAQTITFNAANTPSLHLLNPALWWPNGYGDPNLHTLALSFAIGGVTSDSQNLSFGIRQISYTLPGSTNLALSVNGVPVIAKGGDWGMDEAMKRIPFRFLSAAVQMHRLANYTIIRNWVGQSTSEDFYTACDQNGIMVWDEFFQPNPSDGPDPTNTVLYLNNVREKLLRVRNHPSIALWCGRNEGNPSPAAIAAGNSNLIAALDPSRLYQANSSAGAGVASGGPYHWQVPRAWYNVDAAFKTEIGSMSVPTLEAIQAMMPSNDWTVINDDWAEHDFCSGAQQGNLYPGIISGRYGLISSLADFARKSQLMNYEGFRAIYEGRFAQMFHPVTGVITWMSHPAQPSFVWQLYSHDLEANSSLFAVRKACEPVHIMLNQSNWHLVVVNNGTQVLSGASAVLQVWNLDGSAPLNQTNNVSAAASAATDLGAISFPPGLSPVHFVKLRLLDSQGRLLSDNFYWRETVQDNFQALDSLSMVTLGVNATQQTVGTNCVISVNLTNGSPVVALMSHLQLRTASSRQRVLPVFYSDNYFSLLPRETRSVTITAATADLNGEAPCLSVDGWNVTAAPSPASGNAIAITNNPGAQAHSGPPSNLTRINSGGPATGFAQFGPPYYSGFAADGSYSGGNTASTTNTINTSAANAAPEVVYRTERWGASTYTVPVAAGSTYTVRLHFAETKFTTVGARTFNVFINGRQVLTNFDIVAAGGTNAAVVRDFRGIVPNANNNIVISFTAGTADNPKVCGIELFAAATQEPTITEQPASQYATVGETAVFTVSAVGADTLNYQWLRNGTNLADSSHVLGSCSNTLALANVTTADAGNFQVIVTNSFGAATSTVASLSVAGPFDPSAYVCRMKISFPAYDRAETLSNFPALVTLGANLPGFSYGQFASPTGGDLRFTDSTGRASIPFEIDEWNTNGSSRVWVRVPQLTAGTNFVWAYWGNATAAALPASSTNGAAWSDDHLLVWHLKGPPYTDSSGQYSAQGGGVLPTDALVGQGAACYGSTNFLDAGTLNLTPAFTLSAWVNVSPSAKADIQTIWANKVGGSAANGLALFINSYKTSDASVRLETGNGSAGSTTATAANALSFGQWHLVTAAVDTVSGTARLYVDGLDATASGSTVYPGFGRSSDMNLGRFLGGNFYFTGMMDETRIASTVRSPNWIWATWLNIASNSIFTTCSSVSSQPTLSISRSLTGAVLAWSQAASGFSLYCASNLPANTWELVTNPAIPVNGRWQTSVTADSGARFFRLQQ